MLPESSWDQGRQWGCGRSYQFQASLHCWPASFVYHQWVFHKPISDHVCFGIALLTSKLLSLGALLIGLEYNKCVAIYNVSSTNYEIEDAGKFEQINQTSEPFLLWITGEAYNENRIPKKIRCTLRSFCTFVKNSNYGENKA